MKSLNKTFKLTEIFYYWSWDIRLIVIHILLIKLSSLSLLYFFAKNPSWFAVLPVVIFILWFYYIYQKFKTYRVIKILYGCISAQNGQVYSGLINLRNSLSPGIAILRKDLFILIPVAGRRTKVFFDKITAVNVDCEMSGSLLVDKQVFNISLRENKSVSFALRSADAESWLQELPFMPGESAVSQTTSNIRSSG